jgi:hypothetical protein
LHDTRKILRKKNQGVEKKVTKTDEKRRQAVQRIGRKRHAREIKKIEA